MSDDTIKAVLHMIPYGFYSITSRDGDDVNAMVATWLTQASFEPRLVMLALQKTAYSHNLIAGGGAFAINLFHKDDREAVKPFTKSRAKAPDKMQAAHYSAGPETGCPVLEGAAAYLECKVRQIVDVGGDHDIVVGEVVGAGLNKPAEAADILSLPHIGWSYAG